MITQALMKPGNWSLQLEDDCPLSVAQAFALADHVVVTSNALSPISGFTDANILANSIYTGVCTTKPTPRSFQGYDLSWWMGSPDGVGRILTEPTSLGGSNALSVILANFTDAPELTAGTINDSGLASLTDWNVPGFITYRELLDAACQLTGGEWRVNPDGTYDAALASNLFVTTPTVVVTRKSEGPDGAFRGLDGSMVASEDIEQYTTRVYAVRSIFDNELASSGATTYKNFAGATARLWRAVNATSNSDPLTEIATTTLSQFSARRRQLTLSSRSYDVTRFVQPGDYVYAFDLEAQLFDTANQITWGGEIISPQKLRVYALTWPVQRGMGVYARSTATGSAVYTDLTPYVRWEGDAENPGEVRWEVGAADRAFTDDTSTAGNIGYLGQNGAIVNRIAGATPWSSVSFSGAWVNYGGAYQTAQYRRIDDVVQVRGGIKSGVSGSVAFTLPAGFRPPADLQFAGEGNGVYATVLIASSGAVTPVCASTAFIGINCQFSTST